VRITISKASSSLYMHSYIPMQYTKWSVCLHGCIAVHRRYRYRQKDQEKEVHVYSSGSCTYCDNISGSRFSSGSKLDAHTWK